jgi:hypothetical protein
MRLQPGQDPTYRTPWWLYLPPFWPIWIAAGVFWIGLGIVER